MASSPTKETPEIIIPPTMLSWQMLAYDGSIHLNKDNPLPQITDQHHVLIKVIASSVNLLDVMMMDGYGHVMFNFLRKIKHFTSNAQASEFPITLGRDFVGEIVSKGRNVNSKFSIGMIVMGITLPPQSGSHAQYIIAHQNQIIEKPENVSAEDAVAVLYVGMTAWSALKVNGDFWIKQKKDKKVLVLGASGGVGTVAVQLLNSWKSKVFATCSANAVELVRSLHPEKVFDYTDPSFFEQLKQFAPYDLILDTAGVAKSEYSKYCSLLKPFSFAKFITLMPPYLPETDRYGVFLGLLKSFYDIIADNVKYGSIIRTNTVAYGVVMPFRSALEELTELLKEQQLKAVIDSTFSFTEIPKSYEKAKRGHLRGKVVIKY